MNPELQTLLKDSRHAYKAMKANPEDAALPRWNAKIPSKNILLSSMENDENLQYSGPGTMEISTEQSLYGTSSIKIHVPTCVGVVPEHHRSWDRAAVAFAAGGADWRPFNRVSVWVYPDCPGYRNVWLSLTLQNDGEVKYPRSKYFEGTHHINVENGKWSQIVWEFPYAYRDRVTALVIAHNVHGSQADMADYSAIYMNKLELSVVEEEHYEGWNTDDRIAFCHSGYRARDRKIASTQNSGEKTFCIVNDLSGKTAFEGPVETISADTGTFEVLDFSDLIQEGKYHIEIGNRKSKPFYLGDKVYDPMIWKTINFFYQERCGFDIPGIHLPCHLDHMCVHPVDGRKVSVGGGWHDAGDLSQGQCNTAESALAFLEMAEKVEDDPDLRERLLDEARWGLNWMLRTRFQDGYRCVWTTIGVWSKNIIGDQDDLDQPAYNDPFENFCGAAAEAAGARLFMGEDDVFAAYCLRCAEEDFRFAEDRMSVGADRHYGTRGATKEAQLYGQAGVAAMELYRACGNLEYVKKAARFASVVLACQQQEYPEWEKPIRGFFYEDRAKTRPIAYEHRAHEQAMVLTLSMLVRYAPKEMQEEGWKRGLELYAEYIKAISGLIAPYGLLPSAIYFEKNGDYAHTPREKSNTDQAVLLQKDYSDQVLKGIRLSDGVYLRRFPVAFMFRGFMGVLMTKAKAASSAALALGDQELLEIARKQIEWIVGNNPFCRSYMYGEGYDFQPEYSEFAMDMVGEVPVGIQTFEDHDVPFMPMMNSATYNEVWVHTSSRLLWVIADIY